MKKSVSLSIPRPCAEPWSSFTPTSEGGFCGSCQKTVIDFTRMSDQQILDYLAAKRGKTCGRFRPDQLKTYTFPEPNGIRPGLTLIRAGILGLLLLFTTRPAGSKNIPSVMPPIEATQDTPSREASAASTTHERWFKGVVRDESGAPMPGASIIRKGTTQGTVTDAEGRFDFPNMLKAGDVLVVYYLGFEPLEYLISHSTPAFIEISLTADYISIAGELVLDAPYEETPDSTPETAIPADPKR
ncbi:carboxypeptidase-like regulatory domain-containing protein [Dawidia soli]|uniref:Carboxypeptidase-like regulatory domain-containing protein n=1 Tax=Dawidia soli TaxID=2782352 RepID=A0AAP2DCG5_9BACT|nr:carboxypeptidase-like regulatory domain-containing protein [Dawidia soli]MBT1686817.1 carboxypeptidase-like regulatory domain-containing protein [Dawidia soli]